MDLDAYVQAHGHEWQRLEQLLRVRRPSGAQADELVDRYRQVATHLSVVRTSAPDPALVAHLSSLLAQARGRVGGSRVTTWGAVGSFFARRFPAALYRLRRWWLSTMALSLLLTAVATWWLLGHPAVEQSLLSPGEVEQLVREDFEGYYSEYAAGSFAAQVWVNNAWVTALCLALGVLGVPVLLLLFQNMANLAVIGSIMIRNDRADLFFGLLAPHGLLELTAVFVAAGVGLRLFWSWVEPGDETRGRALAREGRTAGTVALGLVPVLLVSGVVEAFVTPSGLPTWARVGIGVAAWVAFLGYALVVGRAAAARGHTGDVDADQLEDPVASRA